MVPSQSFIYGMKCIRSQSFNLIQSDRCELLLFNPAMKIFGGTVSMRDDRRGNEEQVWKKLLFCFHAQDEDDQVGKKWGQIFGSKWWRRPTISLGNSFF